MSKSECQEWGRLTVRPIKSLGQAIETNEVEVESGVWKIISTTSKIIRSGINSKTNKMS